PSVAGRIRLPARFARVASAASEYTSGIRPVRLHLPAAFLHAQVMATLSSNSTDAEVLASYDDSASYEEDSSRAKALAFVTACRILRRRLPLSAGRGPQSVTRESLDAEISAAKAWLDAHPATTGSGSGRVRYLSMENFRG
ncbi:MAG TPA: hypothetical protein PLF81_28505, partial [Candidatus Anammoximicrobium sp.]|nr:hypothetical protein [Candidatus Anammoximicrobium sp.]